MSVKMRPTADASNFGNSRLKTSFHDKQLTNTIPSVDILTSALIREYLTAKGFKRTLDVLIVDEGEKQRPISSRTELAKFLGILKLVKSNKEKGDQALNTFLEVIVQHLASKNSKSSETSNSSSSTANGSRVQSSNSSSSTAHGSRGQSQDISLEMTNPKRDIIKSTLMSPEFSTTTNGSRVQTPQSKQFNGANFTADNSTGDIDTRTAKNVNFLGAFSLQNPNNVSENLNSAAALKKKLLSKDTPSSEGSEKNSDKCIVNKKGNWLSSKEEQNKSEQKVTAVARNSKSNSQEIEVVEDFDDEEFEENKSLVSSHGCFVASFTGSIGNRGKIITTQKAIALRTLVFPGENGKATFSDEWKGKGFVFNMSAPELFYGLVQLKGGPCGLLASVQAFILKHLLYGNKDTSAIRNGRLRPSLIQCKTSLIEAITEILWQAGGVRHRRSVVALFKLGARIGLSSITNDRYVPDGITENLELHEFSDLGSLRDFVVSNIGQFNSNDPNKHGIIQLLYSVILSRGVDTIKEEDMDEPENKLIGKHGYCTQEMVNLISFGQAVSNIFDGDIVLGDGENHKVLKGIKKPCQFGHLTLFEHYGSLKVGDYLKHPTLPIYIRIKIKKLF